MQYYAMVNTASPTTGFISVGEVLTDKQAAALGNEKIAELVACGVLGEMPDDPEPTTEPTDTSSDDSGEGFDDAPPMPDSEDEYDDNDDEALPELDVADEIVSDTPDESATEKPKKGGRRKAN